MYFLGLCNSARIDRLLANYKRDHPDQPIRLPSVASVGPSETECSVCLRESERLARRIEEISERDVQDKLLELCGHLGSYSDGCKAVIVDSFDLFYGQVSKNNETKIKSNVLKY